MCHLGNYFGILASASSQYHCSVCVCVCVHLCSCSHYRLSVGGYTNTHTHAYIELLTFLTVWLQHVFIRYSVSHLTCKTLNPCGWEHVSARFSDALIGPLSYCSAGVFLSSRCSLHLFTQKSRRDSQHIRLSLSLFLDLTWLFFHVWGVFPRFERLDRWRFSIFKTIYHRNLHCFCQKYHNCSYCNKTVVTCD